MKRISALLALLFLENACNSPQQNTDVARETYLHKYGVPVTPQEWAAHGGDGQVATTYKNGVTVTRSYTGGILQGETTYTFPHSETIQLVETYNEGNLVGTRENYPSGLPYREKNQISATTQKINYWYEEGTPQRIEWVEQGKVLTGEYYTLNNELESRIDQGEGERVRRNSYGQLLSRDTLSQGEMVMRTTFYPNGDPASITPYKNSKTDGLKKTYFVGGIPNTFEEWSEGRQHGITTIFQNGQKRMEIPFKNDKKEGIERHYNDEGLIVEEVAWHKDRKHGPTNYYAEGIVNTEWYYRGSPSTEAQFNSTHLR